MTNYRVKKQFFEEEGNVIRKVGDEVKFSVARSEEILANVNGPYIEEIKEKEVKEEKEEAKTSEETKETKTPKKSK